MNIRDRIKEILCIAIESAVNEGRFNADNLPEVKIEYPKEEKFGDYSTPFALESAKILRMSPMAIGETLIPYIKNFPAVSEAEVVKPGFINIFLSKETLLSGLKDIHSEGDNYGKSEKKNPKKINIEFVSANPTGPMNVVSARAAALGDTLANLLDASGDSVDREFYVNDYGNQVRLLGESVKTRMEQIKGRDVTFPEDGYHGEYIKNIAAHLIDKALDLPTDDTEATDLISREAIEYNVAHQKQDLEKFRVSFNRWFRERALHDSDAVMDTLKQLEKSGKIYEQENKIFFKSSEYGDDKDRVVVREDGRPTYLLADIAYHRDKINRGYDLIIDIWGPDHHGYIARLSGALQALGLPPERFKVLIAQQVNLVMNGETVKMSKRLGKFSTMSDLVEEIGVDVGRYFFVMRSMDSHLDFDLSLAKKHSSENPVFYLQYAHARICSIFREAEKRNVKWSIENINQDHYNNFETTQLLKLMLRFPEEVCDAGENYEPHRLTVFLMRLAQSFHKFYTEHRVLSDDPELTCSYLALGEAVRIIMENGLKFLGVTAPEKM